MAVFDSAVSPGVAHLARKVEVLDYVERAQACKVGGRNFTPEEWSRFVGGRSYSEVCPQYPVSSS
jgi:hypothetical protein